MMQDILHIMRMKMLDMVQWSKMQGHGDVMHVRMQMQGPKCDSEKLQGPKCKMSLCACNAWFPTCYDANSS